mgnify:CR=1 FL=1
MNYYEHTYIASQSLNNKDLSDLNQKIEDIIKKNKGKGKIYDNTWQKYNEVFNNFMLYKKRPMIPLKPKLCYLNNIKKIKYHKIIVGYKAKKEIHEIITNNN